MNDPYQVLETGKDEKISFPERTLLHLGKGAQGMSQEAGQEEDSRKRKKQKRRSTPTGTMTHHTGTESLFVLLFLLLALLGAEYYLLLQSSPSEWVISYPVFAKAASGVLRLGTITRVSFLLCYAAFSFWLVRVSQTTPATRRSVAGTTRVLIILATLVAIYHLLTIHSYEATTVWWLYPASVVVVGLLLPMLAVALSGGGKRSVDKSERRRIDNEHSITIKTQRGYLNVPNPYRGSLVIGSSGSGKSASIGNAFLQQFVPKGIQRHRLRLQVSHAG